MKRPIASVIGLFYFLSMILKHVHNFASVSADALYCNHGCPNHIYYQAALSWAGNRTMFVYDAP